MVSANRLKKVFPARGGDVVAVEEVSFEAHPGQILGVLGANGAGKTTALRMLATVIQPTAGEATVAGYDIRTQATEVRASIGFLSSSTALYGRLTPIEMLRYFAKLYDLPASETQARIDDTVARLNIEPFADRLCDRLSTGQKQRVSIARAILHDPPVIFFDEPTAGLDVVTAQTVLEFIEAQRDAGRTVVFSTHVMSEVERLCDRVVVIHDGSVRASGTPVELMAAASAKSLEKAFLSLVGYAPEAQA